VTKQQGDDTFDLMAMTLPRQFFPANDNAQLHRAIATEYHKMWLMKRRIASDAHRWHE
jgi:hypothetical protein